MKTRLSEHLNPSNIRISPGPTVQHDNISIYTVVGDCLPDKPLTGIGFVRVGDEDCEISVKESEPYSVNTLFVDNASDGQAVVIPQGTVFAGGTQDREVIHSHVLANGYRGDIPVRCVEQGRSSARQDSDLSTRGFFTRGPNAPGEVQLQTNQTDTWNTVEKHLLSQGKKGNDTVALVVVDNPLAIPDDRPYIGIVAEIQRGSNKPPMYFADFFPFNENEDLLDLAIEAYQKDAQLHPGRAIETGNDGAKQFLKNILSSEVNTTKGLSIGTNFEYRNGKAITGILGNDGLYHLHAADIGEPVPRGMQLTTLSSAEAANTSKFQESNKRAQEFQRKYKM
tara:strand:+ start:1399 stop:2412 length:1014 start_codon:yes stop_codon:yes gene_type:complete